MTPARGLAVIPPPTPTEAQDETETLEAQQRLQGSIGRFAVQRRLAPTPRAARLATGS